MLVRCINNDKGDGYTHSLTIDKIYLALDATFAADIRHRTFSVQRDTDATPCLFPFDLFEVVDPRVPPGWVLEHLWEDYFGKGSYCLTPREFTGDFWERFHDGEAEAEKTFAIMLTKLVEFHGGP